MRSPNDPNRTEQTADRNKPDSWVEAAAPPILDPDEYEEYEGLRETTLSLFTDVKVNTTLREMFDFFFTNVEYSRHWPAEPEGYLRHRCRAAIADLRYLQGYLDDMSRMDLSESDEDDRILSLCGRLALRVQKIADALEKKLGPPQDEEEEDEDDSAAL